jgi:hypothetical protein
MKFYEYKFIIKMDKISILIWNLSIKFLEYKLKDKLMTLDQDFKNILRLNHLNFVSISSKSVMLIKKNHLKCHNS